MLRRFFLPALSLLYSRFMHCLSDCFGKREEGISRTQLVSLFLSQETEDSSSKDGDTTYFQSPPDFKELNNEAKFLKACGTITETPTEIRKACQKSRGSLFDEDSELLNCHSWLPHSSIDTLLLDHPDQPPAPVEIWKNQHKGSSSSEFTPRSAHEAYESAGANATATDVHCRGKSVRFECLVNESSPGSLLPDKVSRNGNPSGSKPSPYPTPLKLSDEMQTPGTVFPSNWVELPNGKNQIRSQFVSSILNPVASAAQSMDLEEDSNFGALSVEMRESTGDLENATRISEIRGKETETGKELNDPREKFETIHCRSKSERPSAHLNEDNPTNISSLNINGIPNSTNKYKEDQKVSWHETPFAERLEKAISEENSISKRFLFGKPSRG